MDMGYTPWKFVITTPAAHGGVQCSVNEGALVYMQCYNTTACPWDQVQLSSSKPVLPAIKATLNKQAFRIKAGNLTISGMKVQPGSGATAVNTTKLLKPRICQLNGSLAFYTIDAEVGVYGEFQLQRGMSWSWNATWSAWVADVGVLGTLLFTQEQDVNSQLINMQTLNVKVGGFLTMLSSIYPGPGFSGTYDWAGDLQLTPDPFQEWSKATSLLIQNSKNISTSAVVPVDKSRSLLQANVDSIGQVPVQGLVSVRERATTVENSKATSGILALDDTGDIQLFCGSQCPDLGQPMSPSAGMQGPYLGASEPPASNSSSSITPAQTTSATAGLLGHMPQATLFAAVAASAAVGLLTMCMIGGVMYRRRKRKEEDTGQSRVKQQRMAKPTAGPFETAKADHQPSQWPEDVNMRRITKSNDAPNIRRASRLELSASGSADPTGLKLRRVSRIDDVEHHSMSQSYNTSDQPPQSFQQLQPSWVEGPPRTAALQSRRATKPDPDLGRGSGQPLQYPQGGISQYNNMLFSNNNEHQLKNGLSPSSSNSHTDSVQLRRMSRAHPGEHGELEAAGGMETGSPPTQRLSWFKGAGTTGAANSKFRRVSKHGIGAVELLAYQAGNKSQHSYAEGYAQQELVLPFTAGEAGSTMPQQGPKHEIEPATQPAEDGAAVPSTPQRPRLKWFGKASRHPLPGAAVGDWPSIDKLRAAMPSSGTSERVRKNTAATRRNRQQQQLDDVLMLAPGETGFGSMPGSISTMATKPSARDSMAGGVALPGMFEVENSHGSIAKFAQGLQSSLAGAAAAVTSAFNYR
eukprot:gene14242-14392_t